MSLNDLKRINEKKNACKSTRAERVKKFNKFKDTAHKCFGAPFSTGFGEGAPILCDFCKKRVYKATYKDGKWCCDTCERI